MDISLNASVMRNDLRDVYFSDHRDQLKERNVSCLFVPSIETMLGCFVSWKKKESVCLVNKIFEHNAVLLQKVPSGLNENSKTLVKRHSH